MNPAVATLSLGQRLPNFMRPDVSGRVVNFYQECCATPLLLVTIGQGQPLPSAEDLSDFIQPEWMVVVMAVVQSPDALPSLPGAVLVLADDGQVQQFLAETPGPTALLLDPQFRLLHRQPLAGLSLSAVRRIFSQAASRLQQAPILVVPGVFSPELCQRLMLAYDNDNEVSGVLRSEKGHAVYLPAPEVKIRREHRLAQDHPLWQEVVGRLRLCLLPEISWSYNYQVTHFEGVKVVAYDAGDGGYFAPHRDNDGEDTAHRRFAMTLNLNTPDYADGQLCFPEYGQCVKPDVGSAVVFSCNLAHEARKVTSGIRYALVSFFFSDAEQLKKVDFERRV
ncbi:MAG: 2OG-Fe(II) oxygenase family protein [Lysobacterales bacterium]